ncbi:MAG: hypothetical protein D6706_10555 [Chloroflexi bacterium]|nr:MAG: hypothetical protein D6706_10555 [Chloroflexota bacterium]
MEEERPSLETEETKTSPEIEQTTDTGNTAQRPTGLLIAGFIVVALLIIAGLFLPPISLGERLGLGDNGEQSGGLTTIIPTTETTQEIPGQFSLTLSDPNARVNVKVSNLADFIQENSAAALPSELSPVGEVYIIEYDENAPAGQATITVPGNAGSADTLDLYGWDGTAWQFIPFEMDMGSGQMTTLPGPLPKALALVQTTAPDSPRVAAIVRPEGELPAEVMPHLTEVLVGTLTLGGTEAGMLQGETAEIPTGPYDQYLHVTNVGAVIDQASLSALLANAEQQTSQISLLVEKASTGNFVGVNLDYQAVPSAQGEAFTAYVRSLADALHAQGLKLALTLNAPIQINGRWDTDGQNWAELGQIADTIYIRMPLDPQTYTTDGKAAQVLSWATHHVNRQKLGMLITANAVDRLGEAFVELPNDQALVNFGALQFVQGSEEVEPGTPIEVALSGTASPLEWDGVSLTYKYSYELSEQTHQVWLGNAAALAARLGLAHQFNLGGVAVSGLDNITDGQPYADALGSYLGVSEAPQPSGAAIVWTVRDESGSVLASGTGEELSFVWDGSEQAGNFIIDVDFALGDTVINLDTATVAVVAEEEPVVETTPEPTAAAPTTAETEPPTNTGFDPGDADAVVNTNANVRTGPGLGYGLIAGGASAGTKVSLLGRNSDASWFNIRLPDGQEGWIFASLVTVNPNVDITALEVVEVEPPTVADGGGDSGGSAPPPVSVPPVANSGFELGGQAFGAPYGLMQYAGMTWIKRQHKWSPGQTGDVVAGVIAEAHAAGFKILLSIPGANLYPSAIDFNAYVNFLAQVASLPEPPDAIEVWNEQNIDREWPAGQIDPAAYVNNILAPAYNAIKAANPNIMVISGAPAPTGFFGGCSGAGCDDGVYVAGMAAAGAASYMDCIGIHYNEGIISPNQTSGDPRSHHYTRYFWGMVDTYWNAFGGARPLCFTELGYLTPEGYGSLPGGFAWAQNVTVSQQAQWLAEAASLSASSGKVRLMIVWNVDSTTWGDDPQAGYAIIRPGGSCPACETLRQVMGGG